MNKFMSAWKLMMVEVTGRRMEVKTPFILNSST
jgi:hypothetical protein